MSNDADNPPWTKVQIARGRVLAAQKRRGRPSLEHPKESVTIRLDREVLVWLRQQGDGYQTRINQLLHECMERTAR